MDLKVSTASPIMEGNIPFNQASHYIESGCKGRGILEQKCMKARRLA
jgi:hypothetical protein